MTKILFFIDTLKRGGAAKALMNLVNAMNKTQYDITVQTIFKEDIADKFNDDVSYKYCFERQNKLTELMARVETAVKVIYPLHIKDNYDYECAYLESISTKIIATSTNSSAKHFAWVHCDIEKMASNSKKYALKTGVWYKKYDSIICVSETVRDSFCRVFGHEYDTKVVYNVIDSDDIIKKSASQIPNNIKHKRITVLTAGTLYSPKNHLRLLKSCKKLLEEGIVFDTWILGDGPDRPMLERYISENNLQNNIFLLGYYDNPYPIMKAADILACSSNYEGFSTFVTEGLILGKAIVTTDVSGMQELLRNNEYGLITQNDDTDFCEGLRSIILNKSLVSKYEMRAQQRCADFSLEHTTKMSEELFDNK